MTYKQLKQYTYLKREIADLDRRINLSRQNGIKNTPNGDISDCLKRPAVDGEEVERLKKQTHTLCRLRYRAERQLDRIEEWLLTVNSSEIRQIVRHRIILGKSWRSVARAMGQSIACAESLRKRLERFLESGEE